MTVGEYHAGICRRGILPAIDPRYPGPYTIEQNPRELAEFCEFIQSQNIRAYLEVGTSTGGLLNFFAEVFRWDVFGVDLRLPVKAPANAGLFIGSTRSEGFREFLNLLPKLDLVWIDADHSYESVKADAEACLRLSPRFMVFHDICGLRACEGSARHWAETKAQHYGKTVEFVADDETRVGIGVLIR
jgi:hypothetical protein